MDRIEEIKARIKDWLKAHVANVPRCIMMGIA
jgi:hypothetical protein